MVFIFAWLALATGPFLPAPVPSPAAVSDPGAAASSSQPRVLYLNFDGGTLYGRPNCSDAIRNCSHIIFGGTDKAVIPPFAGTSQARDTIVDIVKAAYAPFNIQIVTTRPSADAYTMCMVGGEAGKVGLAGQGAAGVAPLDCEDSTSHADIAFAFSDTVASEPVPVAVTIAQESAHAWGLSHVDDPTDIMYPALGGSPTKRFQDRASRVCNLDSTFACQSASGCDGKDTQNSYQALVSIVGPASAGPPRDMTPPSIDIRAPQTGAIVGPQFALDFGVADDIGVTRLELYADGQLIGGAGAAPWTIEIPDGFFADGIHTFRGVAYDAANNHTTSSDLQITQRGGVGGSCTKDADCQMGRCMMDGLHPDYCSRNCQSGDDCPTGFACGPHLGNSVCLSQAPVSTGGGGCSMLPSELPGGLFWVLIGLGGGLGRSLHRRRTRESWFGRPVGPNHAFWWRPRFWFPSPAP